MLKLKHYLSRAVITIGFLILSGLTLAANDSFVAGKDYQVLNTPIATDQASAAKIPIIEFFSYGCPACYQFDPYLTTWLKTKPQQVVFDRVPVLFHAEWQPLSQVYYTAKNMGILDKVHQQIFIAIHQQQQNLNDVNAIAALFHKYAGVKADDVISNWQFSPAINTQLSHADAIAQAYQIRQIPTIAIAGKYLLDPSMSNGNLPRMIATLNYLVAKVRGEQQH